MNVKKVELCKGEIVNRLNKASQAMKAEYVVNGYCRNNRKYELTDCSDISKWIYLKKGTLVNVI